MGFKPFVLQTLLQQQQQQSDDDGNGIATTTAATTTSASGATSASASASASSSSSSSSSSAASAAAVGNFESIDVWEKHIFLGTSDGYVCHYVLHEEANSDGKMVTSLQSKYRMSLGLGSKSVSALIVLGPQEKLAALCDGKFGVYNMMTLKKLAGINILKGVQDVSVDPGKSPHHDEFCMVRKKSVTLFEISDKIAIEKDIALLDTPICAVRHGQAICFADTHEYKLISPGSRDVISLTPFDNSTGRNKRRLKPLILYIPESEFLLATSQSDTYIGIFVSFAGQPIGSTLTWKSFPVAIEFLHPYVLTVERSCIEIHSVLDSKLQQHIDFVVEDANIATDHNSRVYICTKTGLHMLTHTSPQNQLEALLHAGRITDAIDLAEEYEQSEEDKNPQQGFDLRDFYVGAGFSYLCHAEFPDAVPCFLKASLDPNVLMSLFPEVCPLRLIESPPQKAMIIRQKYKIDSIETVVRNVMEVGETQFSKHELLDSAYGMLAHFLTESKRCGKFSEDELKAADTCLLKIYAIQTTVALYSMLKCENHCDLEECESYLKPLQFYYAISLLYLSHRRFEEGFSLWRSLIDGNLKDDAFGGFEEYVSYLATLDDPEVVFRASDWALRRNPLEGAKIFTSKRTTNKEEFEPRNVLKYLAGFDRAASYAYLEYLVLATKNQEEPYSTMLASYYYDDFKSCNQPSFLAKHASLYTDKVELNDIEETFRRRQDQATSFVQFLTAAEGVRAEHRPIYEKRLKFLTFLQTNPFYSGRKLMEILKDTTLYAERAILLGKTGEHVAALELLVFDLQDYYGAEEYCLRLSKDDPELRKKLFLSLFGVYSSPYRPNRSTEPLVEPIMRLFNVYSSYLDPLQLMQLLPNEWSVSMMYPFLSRSIRQSFHTQADCQIVRSLYRAEHIQVHAELIRLQSKFVVINEGSRCGVCHRPIDGIFTRYPNNLLAHVTCAPDKYVCPVSGVDFRRSLSATKATSESGSGATGNSATHTPNA